MRQYNLVIGPLDDDPRDLSPEDFAEMLTDAGWRSVRIEWVEPTETPGDAGKGRNNESD